MTTRLPSFWWAARELTSWLMPSSMSPSLSDAPDVVVEGGGAGLGVRVEQAALAAGRHRHARRRCRGPGRAGRWWSPRPRCGRARGDPASGCPTGAGGLQVVQREPVAGQEELDVERQAGVPGRTGRTGHGRPSWDRSDRAASTAGRAGRRRGPGSSRCRGVPSPPSPLRPSPGPERRRRPACRGRSIQGLARVRCSSARSPESSRHWWCRLAYSRPHRTLTERRWRTVRTFLSVDVRRSGGEPAPLAGPADPCDYSLAVRRVADGTRSRNPL